MAYKRLIACCDGTWNDADSEGQLTNVIRMSHAIRPYDDRKDPAVPQIVYYHVGVGTGDLVNKAVGGGLGMGLSRNVRDAYAFLANNYCEGDELFLFGFSRGAYTARSVAGLIGYAGLLHKKDLDDFALLWEGYRLRGEHGHENVLEHFPDRHFPVQIKCIGVWDTVGALGIPGHLDHVFREFYEFHDTGLGEHVENAFHALALDERRSDFAPTLWFQKPEAKAAGQVMRQVWFPGVHSNIGGGYEEHGVSDVTLAWMAGQVDELLALDYNYLKARQDRRDAWGMGRLYDSDEGFWKLRRPKPRRPLAGLPEGETNELLHASVLERMKQDAPCVPSPYRSDALAGIDLMQPDRVAPLSPVETSLRWTETRQPPADASNRPKPNFLGRFLQALGG